MLNKKKSFFERLTGSVRLEDDNEEVETNLKTESRMNTAAGGSEGWMEEAEDAELAVDVYQTPTEIIVQAMVAGVRPEDLSINISRDMLTLKGKREETRTIQEDNYFIRELYWGSFSRTILLPQEVEPEEAEAAEKHGMLVIKLPKIDKEKKHSVKVKSL
jgi:HSP20 family protein